MEVLSLGLKCPLYVTFNFWDLIFFFFFFWANFFFISMLLVKTKLNSTSVRLVMFWTNLSKYLNKPRERERQTDRQTEAGREKKEKHPLICIQLHWIFEKIRISEQQTPCREPRNSKPYFAGIWTLVNSIMFRWCPTKHFTHVWLSIHFSKVDVWLKTATRKDARFVFFFFFFFYRAGVW